MLYRPFFICLLTSGSLCFAADNHLTHLPTTPTPYPTTWASYALYSPTELAEWEKKAADNYLTDKQLNKTDQKKVELPVQEKIKLIYTEISGPLFQDEVDAVMILQRFSPDFLKEKNDYHKLNCPEFTRNVIHIYENALSSFLETNAPGAKKEAVTLRQNIHTHLPDILKNQITLAIENYLKTILFINLSSPPQSIHDRTLRTNLKVS